MQEITLDVGVTDRFQPSTFVVHPGMVRVVLKYVGTGAPHNFQVVAFPADFVPLTSDGQTEGRDLHRAVAWQLQVRVHHPRAAGHDRDDDRDQELIAR